MFGYKKIKREKRRAKRERGTLDREKMEWEKGNPQREKEASDFQQAQVEEKSGRAAQTRKNSYAEGRKRIQDLYNDDSIQGIDPQKRQALQYEANKGIQRSMQSANRKLLGDQGQHGIVGKGGVGYAQQRDLQRLGTEAQAGAQRDISKQNADLRLKNIAAIYAGEQGEAAQSQLDNQMALDQLQFAEEKKRQRNMEDQLNRLFSRV
jgi:hypothetical protein